MTTVPGIGEGKAVRNGDWLPEDTTLKFTGMKMVYNGTEDFQATEGIAPFYPRNEFFKIEMVSTLGLIVVDNSSSGREFLLEMNAGSMPIEMAFNIHQVGIPEDRMINGITPFKVRVDTDTPTAPPGIMVHGRWFR
ncbi:MAG: hypothetical protein MZU91_13330 [Desulfosudis oleivorans]|nr:hypothetical protein [Desulfosudis oleivorans]